MFKTKATLVAIALHAAASSLTAAQTDSHVTVKLDSGWTLESSVVNNEIVGFFAWIPDDLVTPGNVYLAYLEHAGNGAWTMHGWNSGDAANAITAIEAEANTASLYGVVAATIDGSIVDRDACGPTLQPGNQGGTAMPNGVTTTDPAASLMEAIAGDFAAATATLSILTSSGASAAPDLSTLFVGQTTCQGANDADVFLSRIALEAATQSTLSLDPQESADMQTLIGGCGWPCFPWTFTFSGPWSAWNCTGGPFTIAGASGSCGCRYTGCTRSRTVRSVSVDLFCNYGPVTTATQSQGPQNKTCPASPPQTSNCPPQPSC